jgi:hypothetical protein
MDRKSTALAQSQGKSLPCPRHCPRAGSRRCRPSQSSRLPTLPKQTLDWCARRAQFRTPPAAITRWGITEFPTRTRQNATEMKGQLRLLHPVAGASLFRGAAPLPNHPGPRVLRHVAIGFSPPPLARTLGQRPTNSRSGKAHGPIEPIFAIFASLAKPSRAGASRHRPPEVCPRHSTAFVRGILLHYASDPGPSRRARPIAPSLHLQNAMTLSELNSRAGSCPAGLI